MNLPDGVTLTFRLETSVANRTAIYTGTYTTDHWVSLGKADIRETDAPLILNRSAERKHSRGQKVDYKPKHLEPWQRRQR